MSLEDGIDLLMGLSRPTTTEGWIQLIKTRRKLLRPYLGSGIRLERLGSVPWPSHIGVNLVSVGLGRCSSITVTGKRFSLATEGIFFQPSDGLCQDLVVRPKHESQYDVIRFIWGITSTGQWLLTRIGVVFKEERTDTLTTHTARDEVAKSVHIRETSLPKLLSSTGILPREVWVALGVVIKHFHMQEHSRATRRLHEIVRAEDLMVGSISRQIVA